ncbi:VOC family protein [Candidatus Clostridium stratigraminis]|uniref:VOC family protein n=1 Tax=Candidatus Clostridium stratigraminis TaxID=3381661 RepID=A0ABW8T592_9CLOT
MSIKAYINFNGNCREAVEFYAKVFQTEKPEIMLFGDMPSSDGFLITEETKNLVMHAEIKIKDSTIMFSDVPPGMPFTIGDNISLIFSSNDMDEIKSVYNQLKAEGNVGMELQETFWSKCYGYVTDRYGIGWQLICET